MLELLVVPNLLEISFERHKSVKVLFSYLHGALCIYCAAKGSAQITVNKQTHAVMVTQPQEQRTECRMPKWCT
jgi:hypothetical protein